jgi:hypothetical protein
MVHRCVGKSSMLAHLLPLIDMLDLSDGTVAVTDGYR